MTEEQFNKHKESLAVNRLEKPKIMSTLSSIFWHEISSQLYNFDRVNIEVAYLRTITKEQILKFYEVRLKKICQTEIENKFANYLISLV